MADNLDEVFGNPTLDTTSEPDPAPVEPAPVEQPEVAEPEPQPAPQPTPEPEAPKDEPRSIPLATALQWRDEARELKRWKEQQEAQQRQPAEAPDPFDDPTGFASYQQQQVQQAIIADRFERSNEDAIEKWGEDKVRAAVQWAEQRVQSNPGFAAEYMNKTRPIHWIVQQHERDALLSDIGGNVDDWFAREAAKRGYAPQNAPVAAPVAVAPQPASPPARAPRSIATMGSGPSDVRSTATGPLAGVDALFG